MHSNSIRRSVLSHAVLIALMVPSSLLWAVAPNWPEQPVRDVGAIEQRQAAMSSSRGLVLAMPMRSNVFAEGYGPGNSLLDVLSDGFSWRSAMVIGHEPNRVLSAPSVAMERWQDRHAVAWVSAATDGQDRQVRLQFVDVGGAVRSAPVTVGWLSFFRNQDNPAVAMDASGRHVATAWSGEGPYGGHSVFAQLQCFGCDSGSSQRVDMAIDSSEPVHPAITVDGSGTSVVAWVGNTVAGPSSRGVQYRVALPYGGFADAQMILDATPGAVFGSVAISQELAGQKVVVWTRDGGVFAQRLDAQFRPIGALITVASVDGVIRSNARVSVDPEDGFWVGWQSTGQDGDGEGVFVRQYRKGGQAVSAEFQVNQNSAGNQQFGGISSAAVGNLMATWDRPIAAGSGWQSYERMVFGRDGADFAPTLRINSAQLGQEISVALDIEALAPSSIDPPPTDPIQVTLRLPPDHVDARINPTGCSGVGTTTVTCSVPIGLGAVSLHFPAPTAATLIPLSASIGLGFVDGNPDNDNTSALIEVFDTQPDAFTFAEKASVPLNSMQTSSAITVSGINARTPISVSGGSYSIDGAAFTNYAGEVTSGQNVRVQHIASSSYATATGTTLTIGGVSDTFTSTTLALDTTPDAFSFVDQSGVRKNTQVLSNTIIAGGINSAAPISISGGNAQFSRNGGAWTSVAGSVNNGDTVVLRVVSSNTGNNAVNVVLTIGGVNDTWTVRTR